MNTLLVFLETSQHCDDTQQEIRLILRISVYLPVQLWLSHRPNHPHPNHHHQQGALMTVELVGPSLTGELVDPNLTVTQIRTS